MSFTFTFQRRIEFSETDMAGIVHFSNFFRMMEATEHAFLRSLGFSVHLAGRDGSFGWPRVKASCEYVKPLRFEELVDIDLTVAEVRNRSVCYRFVFRRAIDQEEVARGEMVSVCANVDPVTGVIAAVPIPSPQRDQLNSRLSIRD
jgi:acyl-CoA thioester hydrolase